MRGLDLNRWVNAGVPVLLVASILGCTEDALEPTVPVQSAQLAATAEAPSFRQVIASFNTNVSCGVTTDNRAFCWGSGYLGNDATSQSETPVPVSGGLQFRQISSGINHSCGVTVEDRVYCWGRNFFGEVGDGTLAERRLPVAVAGTRRYRMVSAGYFHTCALGRDNRTYCWGSNTLGKLGDGTTTNRLRPVAVAGGHFFSQVSAGAGHTCGVTTASRAFCWGDNNDGRLGLGENSTVQSRRTPSPVAGDRSFRQVSAGSNHTCGVTSGNRAFCWGNGSDGQIGDGRTHQRWAPRAVSGGLSFERISAGVFHTCAETTTNRAYCWGSNTYGGLGNGTASDPHLTPVAVTGGHLFSQVSAGSFHTCGVTTEDRAYCWGRNFGGAVGDGTREDRWVPTAVKWEEEMW
jgi:alpha-tubulin suppressor-like RCC1 family protein